MGECVRVSCMWESRTLPGTQVIFSNLLLCFSGGKFALSPMEPKGFIEACHKQGLLAVPAGTCVEASLRSLMQQFFHVIFFLVCRSLILRSQQYSIIIKEEVLVYIFGVREPNLR